MARMRVLLIDDERALARILVQVFEDAGFDAESAGDGDSGLSSFRAQPFDAVVTDILMPEREGFATIQDMRRHAPDTVIIALSGCGRVGPDAIRDVALQAGADGFMAKPFMAADLVALTNLKLAERRPASGPPCP